MSVWSILLICCRIATGASMDRTKMSKNEIEILKATEMGFCSGVRGAVEAVEKAVPQRGRLESLGGICHNQQVVDRLAAKGVEALESLDKVKGPTVVITSHGVGPQVMEGMKAKGLEIIDTTCPFVRSAQSPARFAHFVSELLTCGLSEMREVRIVNTICDDTRERQAAAAELARRADIVLVIGGRNSANTRRLAGICEAEGVETPLIQQGGA